MKNSSIIKERIVSLRKVMRQYNIQAFIIPSTDPHMSEYVAPHWESRKWLSGFTGSAGTVVITESKAGLWTDSRYFLQATEQLQDSGIVLYKEKLSDTPSIPEWIKTSLGPNQIVGIDGTVFSAAEVEALRLALTPAGISIKSIPDPIAQIWADRPLLPQAPAQIYPLEYAGKTTIQKVAEIREKLQQAKVDSLLLSSLDEIAWTLNLRGTDIHCNPLVISHLFITHDDIHFFISPEKVTPNVQAYLKASHITIHPYDTIEQFLQTTPTGKVLLNTARINYTLYSALTGNTKCNVIYGSSPVSSLKAIRNNVEIAGIHQAMKRDGVALVRFLIWLEKSLHKGEETEISIAQKLHSLRREQPLYIDESFDTIAGYGPHAAIVHYEATPETDVRIEPHGFLLLDSGAQYLDGTTDITRTIAVGPLTEEEKEDYTLILKGHINLAMAVFPEGTRGAQLDVLARMPIWKKRCNYLHGTGHGVGHYLNVHEGPQSIRMEENPVSLRAGMVTSNEPGIYKAGSHGIRIENLILTVPAGEGMFGNYLQFETLTLCPICKKGIRTDLLNSEEIDWLNQYHQHVYDVLSPELNEEERLWLEQATAKI